MNSRILISLLVVLSVTSCAKESEDITNESEENVSVVESEYFSLENQHIDIVKASSLIVLDSDFKNSASSLTGKTENTFLQSNLFKVDLNGQIENLSLFNLEQDDPQYEESVTVEKIQQINDEYIVLEGTFNVSSENSIVAEYNKILVRKSDGALFSFDIFPSNIDEGHNGENAFQTDGEGNIYFLSEKMVYKMDSSNPEKIIIEEYLSSGQIASYFSVDSEGNCIYTDDYDYSTKIRKKNGGIVKIESLTNEKRLENYWQGRDGNIYMLTNHGGATNLDSTTGISRLSSNDNELELILSWEANTDETVFLSRTNHNQYILDKDNNTVYFFGIGGSWRYNELSETVEIIEVPDNSYTKLSNLVNPLKTYSNENMYLASDTFLAQISLNDLSYRTLVDGGYEIYNILLLDNGNIQLSALRYEDGVKILGELDLNGNLTILDEDQNKEATILTKLN